MYKEKIQLEGEKNFERAKQEVMKFIDTPAEKLDIDPTKPLEIIDLLKEKFENLMKTDPEKAQKFLTSLLINEPVDDSSIPPCFTQTKKFSQKSFEKRGWVWREKENFHPDIFRRVDFNGNPEPEDGEWDIDTTYRTYYFSAIIETLGSLGEKAENDLLECLKEMDNIAQIPITGEEQSKHWQEYINKKLGVDITRAEFDKILAEYEKDTGILNIESEQDVLERISKGNIHVFGPLELTAIRNHYDLEFGLPYTKIAEALNKIENPSQKTLEYLIKRIEINDTDFRENFYNIINILNKNASYSGKQLLDFIKKEKDPYSKALATRALYHIELGKVGISRQGVQYLDKMYDLGPLNNPDYFAHRATGEGQVAIFDEDQKALGYFQLHSLDSPEKKLHADFLEFSYETLFTPKPDETKAEKKQREAVLEEFKEKYFQTYLTDFFEKTGVRFNNMRFPEQGQFLWYAQNASEKDKKRAMEFISQYREPGFRAFLSLDADQNNGEKILQIGEKLNQSAAQAIFDKYSQIVDQTEQVRDYLRQNFDDEKEFSEQTVNQIINNLLQKGRDLLADFADKTKKRKGKIDTSEVLKELADIQTENLLFLSSFKELKRAGEKFSFEDIKNLQFNIENAAELKKQDIEQMKEVYAKNYEEYPDLQKQLLADFDKAAKSEKTIFYTLKHKDQVVAFNRFDDLGKGRKRFASFNVDPDFKGAKLGEAMMERSIDIESQNNILEATCLSFTPISGKYIESGFTAKELIDYQGLPVLKIEKDNKKESEYAFKNKSKQEIVDLFEKEYKDKELTGAEEVIIKQVKPDQSGKNFEILNQGYVLTRYFREKGQAYLVFEKEKEEKTAKLAKAA